MKSGSQRLNGYNLMIIQSSNSAIIGIVSTDPDYKLSLKINRKLKISLKNDSPVILGEDSGNEYSFQQVFQILRFL